MGDFTEVTDQLLFKLILKAVAVVAVNASLRKRASNCSIVSISNILILYIDNV